MLLQWLIIFIIGLDGVFLKTITKYKTVKNNHSLILLACGLILTVSGLFSCQKKQSIANPEENRFIKTVLTQGEFFEPTEMTILPNLDILVVQRRGEILKFDNATRKVKQVGFLNVYYRSAKANTEEGLLGITADPDFDSNHYVYI